MKAWVTIVLQSAAEGLDDAIAMASTVSDEDGSLLVEAEAARLKLSPFADAMNEAAEECRRMVTAVRRSFSESTALAHELLPD